MHTPGPWTIEIDHSCDEAEFIRTEFDGEMFDIATLSNESGNVNSNARLIAAAPDLLDALKRVMRHVPADAGGASLGDDMYRARLAIARATGGK